MSRVAISGKMGSGKSTLASALSFHFNGCAGTDGQVYSFAAKLKEIAADVYGMDTKDRRLLQTLGDNMRQVVDDSNTVRRDVWVDYLLRKMDNDYILKRGFGFKDASILQVVDDLRYKNEYDKLRSREFFIIRMECNPEIRTKRLKKPLEGESHKSETDLDDTDDWDFIMYNNGPAEGITEICHHILKILTGD